MALTVSLARRLMAEATGAEDWQFEPFDAGKFSDVLRASRGKESLVLRVAPPDDLLQLFYEYRMMRREAPILERLAKETAVPVPGVVHCDFTRELIDRDWMVLTLLPGEPLSRLGPMLDELATNRVLRQWGQHIAQVHALRAEDGLYGYRGDLECMRPRPTWAQAFRAMYRRLLDDIVVCGVYSDQQAEQAQRLLEENLSAFEHDALPALLHGDIWLTNLLVDRAGRVTGLLDFDRACWGDVEWDLAIAEYCGVTRPPFWQGYGRRIEPSEPASVRRMFYLLYEHQKYIVISVSARHDDPARAARFARESLAVMERFARTSRPAF